MTIDLHNPGLQTEVSIPDYESSPFLSLNQVSAEDETPPSISSRFPGPGVQDVLLDAQISFNVTDTVAGVNPETVTVFFDGVKVYEEFNGLDGYVVDRTDVSFGYRYVITPPTYLPDFENITVQVLADDYLDNTLDVSWTFKTVDAPFLLTPPADPNNRYMLDTPMVWVIKTYSTNVVVDSLVINGLEVISNNVIDAASIESGSISHTINETTISLISERPVPWRDNGVVTMNWTLQYHDDANPGVVESTGSFASVGSVYYLKVWKDPVVDDIFVIRDNEFQALVFDPRDPLWDDYLLAISGDPDGYWQGSIVGNGTGGLDVTVDAPHNYFPGEYFNWEMFYQEVDGVDAYRSGQVYNPPDGYFYGPTEQYQGTNLNFDTDKVDHSTSPGGGSGGSGTAFVGTVSFQTPTGTYTPVVNGTIQPGWSGNVYYDYETERMEFFLDYQAGFFDDLETTDEIIWRVVFTLGGQIYLEQQGSIYRPPANELQDTNKFTTSKTAYFTVQELPIPQAPRLYFISPTANELTVPSLGSVNISLTGQGKVYRPGVNVYMSSSDRPDKMPAIIDGYSTPKFTGNSSNVISIQELIDGYDEYGFDFTIDTSQIAFDPFTNITVDVEATDELDEPLTTSYTFQVREYEVPRVVSFPENVSMNRFGHISFSLTDAQSGVDLDATSIVVGGITAFENGSFSSSFVNSTLTPRSDGYDFLLVSEQPYASGQQVAIQINPVDNHGN